MSVDPAYRNACFPNRISRILLLALQDVLGADGSSAVLTTAKLPQYVATLPPVDFEPGLTFSEIGRLFEALESITVYRLVTGWPSRLVGRASSTGSKVWAGLSVSPMCCALSPAILTGQDRGGGSGRDHQPLYR